MYPLRNFTENEIEYMKNYKYQSRNEPILYQLFIQSMFDYLHVFIPDSIMPNQLTMAGLLCMLISVSLTVYMNPNLVDRHRSLALANLILLAIYFSTDFVDGMHARRTMQCSPMGAVMDHGVDSMVTGCIILSLASSLRLGINTLIVFFSYIALFGFYIAGLHIKYAGYLKFNAISGPSEGLVSAMIIHVISWLRPEFIDCMAGFVKSSKINKYKSRVLSSLLALLTVGWIYELFHSIAAENRSLRTMDVVISLSELLFLLSFLSFLAMIDISSNIQFFYNFFFILIQNFTVCYVEETISSMAGTATDMRVFLFAYIIFSALCFSFSFRKQYKLAGIC
ncbi:uncharacterized protein VICG_00264, partial [Vittaforma corneae ATCC 50505]